MIYLSLREPFESEGHGALKVLDKIETIRFELCIVLILSSFCRRASLWSELYSEHPDNNKKGIISDRKLSDVHEYYMIRYQILMLVDMIWYDAVIENMSCQKKRYEDGMIFSIMGLASVSDVARVKNIAKH